MLEEVTMPIVLKNGKHHLVVEGDLTFDDVVEGARFCEELGRDDAEGAHRLQDEVYLEVLKACALMHPQAVQLAKAALTIDQLPFSRW
jgi:hypothetical protein